MQHINQFETCVRHFGLWASGILLIVFAQTTSRIVWHQTRITTITSHAVSRLQKVTTLHNYCYQVVNRWRYIVCVVHNHKSQRPNVNLNVVIMFRLIYSLASFFILLEQGVGGGGSKINGCRKKFNIYVYPADDFVWLHHHRGQIRRRWRAFQSTSVRFSVFLIFFVSIFQEMRNKVDRQWENYCRILLCWYRV